MNDDSEVLKESSGVPIIPAIDIRGGKCVRLYQGDFDRETVFSDDPVSVAKRWIGQGATALHVVDLDGAKRGAPQNLEIVQAIVRATRATVDFGGGLRSLESVERAFDAGVAKVDIGTALLSDPGLLDWIVRKYSTRVLAALDCRDGTVLSKGWLSATGIPVRDAARRLMKAGLYDFVYTDGSRDGTLGGPDLGGIGGLLELGARVVASGGVSNLRDISALASMRERGLQGIIIGQAFYVSSFTLAEAIRAAVPDAGADSRSPDGGE